MFLFAFVLLAQSVDIRLEDGAVKVAPGAGGSIEVYTSLEPGAPAVLGSMRTDGEALVFQPRYPLRPGIRCRVIFRSASGAETQREFTVAAAAASPPTRVDQVYPSGQTLPENQLKLYLHFSGPMSRGEAYSRIRLLDAVGKAVDFPFLEVDQELWDASGKRLTVFFDPGRVKRDLLPNVEVGLPLVAGRRYTLVIDAGWMDAQGTPLAAEYRKPFEVTAADRTKPSLDNWRIAAPPAGTREPLVVDLKEPMDHGLLLREIGVNLKGDIAIDRHETRWLFTPAEPWTRGAYELTAGTALEDLAGNRLDRLFDVDRFDRVDKNQKRETRRLRFHVR